MVDAEDSKSSARKGVRVQVSPPAPPKIKGLASISLLNLFYLMLRGRLALGKIINIDFTLPYDLSEFH